MIAPVFDYWRRKKWFVNRQVRSLHLEPSNLSLVLTKNNCSTWSDTNLPKNSLLMQLFKGKHRYMPAMLAQIREENALCSSHSDRCWNTSFELFLSTDNLQGPPIAHLNLWLSARREPLVFRRVEKAVQHSPVEVVKVHRFGLFFDRLW